MHRVDADVIIIGAGLAGLTTAYHILQKEPTLIVYILESSNAIGGRLHNVPLLVQNGNSVSFFNMSGDRICSQQTQLLRLLNKIDVSTYMNKNIDKITVQCKERYETSDRKDILGFLSVAEKIELTKFILKVETICHDLSTKGEIKLLTELSEINLRDFIRNTIKSKTIKTVIEYIILYNCGCNTHEISALFYIFFCISTKGIVHQLWFNEDNLYELKTKNSNVISTRLAEEIGAHNIKTKQTVLKITNKEKYVKVVTESEVYRCSHIIVCVSPRQLLKIRFKPALPQGTLSYIEDTCSSIVTHFLVTYPKEFWRERNLSGELHVFDRNYSEGPIVYCENVSKRKRAALKGCIVSERCIENDEVPFYKQRVLEQLSDYFGEEALNPIDYYEKSWFWDAPYMSCWKMGNTQFHKDVFTTFERIHFAGSETSMTWYGLMAGAVDSGIRAAREVMYNLRPSSLTSESLHNTLYNNRYLRGLEDAQSRTGQWRLHWRLKFTAVGLTILAVLKLINYLRRIYKYFFKQVDV